MPNVSITKNGTTYTGSYLVTRHRGGRRYKLHANVVWNGHQDYDGHGVPEDDSHLVELMAQIILGQLVDKYGPPPPGD